MKNRKIVLCGAILATLILIAGCGGNTSVSTEETKAVIETTVAETTIAEETSGAVAGEKETVSQVDVVKAGMVPIFGTDLKDGVYDIEVDSSSNMFKITSCQLTVKAGHMSALMSMAGTGYLKVFMGTGDDALKATEKDYIPFVEDATGVHTYEIPVEALDMGIDCSAFSKNKEKWYNRTLVFRADSLPMEAFADGQLTTVESLNLEDGNYTVEVTLEGGSGRTAVESPAKLYIEAGKAYATIVWGSSNYDYMKVDEEKFDCINTEGNATFEIPVNGFDWRIPVIADTIAMSVPHEISYTLNFDSSTIVKAE